jgi:hypothetical protein
MNVYFNTLLMTDCRTVFNSKNVLMWTNSSVEHSQEFLHFQGLKKTERLNEYVDRFIKGKKSGANKKA